MSDTSLPQRRELRTPLPGPKSQELAARRSAVVSTGVSSTLPVYVARAGGGVVQDVDGNTLIDLGSGIAVTTVGNAAPRVVEGVADQVADFTHTCFMITPYEEYVAVCEALAELTPGDHAKKTALFNSGAEAVENAVKVARYATGRTAVVAVDHAYHGRTNLTMALTAKAMPYKKGFGPFASDIYRVPTSYPFRDPEGMTGEQAAARAIAMAEKQVGGDQIAALIIEPIQGEGGFVVPAPGFLPALQRWCNDNGIVLDRRRGADRVHPHRRMVRLRPRGRRPRPGHRRQGHRGRPAPLRRRGPCRDDGRRARRWPGRHVRRQPGGLRRRPGLDRDHALGGPARRRAADRGPGQGPPAGHRRQGARDRRHPRARRHARDRVRQAGHDRARCRADRAVAKACHEQGVLVLTCGTYGNVIRLLPPLVISDELLLEGLQVLEDAMVAITA